MGGVIINMMAYQMIGVADQNGRTYESKFGTYNKEKKFVLMDEYKEIPNSELLDEVLHADCWSLKQDPVKKMTKEEIEKELGYKIEIEHDEDPALAKALSDLIFSLARI